MSVLLYQSDPELLHHFDLPFLILFPLFLLFMWPLLGLICKEVITLLREKHCY